MPNIQGWRRYPGDFEMPMILTWHCLEHYAGKVARKMVHIYKNVRRLYLPKVAYKELGLTEGNFPHSI